MIAAFRAWARVSAFARLIVIVQATFAVALPLTLSACGGDVDHPIVRIVAQPSDQSAVGGQSATFSVVASGPAGYQWQRLAGEQWQPVAGGTQASVTLAAVQSTDDGAQFRVVVTNTANAANAVTSSAATLSVTAAPQPPAVTVQPADMSLPAGLDGSLSVTATGTALSYQWQRSTDGMTFANIDGATSHTLAIGPVQAGDNGASFRVIVSNSLGQVASAVARLTVTAALAAPTFVTSPADTSAVAGQSATFGVAVTGTPTPTLGWQSSVDGTTWIDIADEHAATLVLAAVAAGDSGKHFRAVATNATGTVQSSAATLTVTAPVAPAITVPPASVEVGVGATPTFSVAATGTPTPAYQWQLSVDGGATFANINGATSATYTLGAVALADSGHELRVVVQNDSARINSPAATLTVIAAPSVTRAPTSQAWRPGLASPTFEVAAAGTGLSYRWQISTDGASYADVPGGTGAALQLASPPSVNATVRVVVTDGAGETVTTAPVALTYLNWTYVAPTPTGDEMYGVRWLDAGTTAVAVGDGGTILRTTDAGVTWTDVAESGGAELRGVDFMSATTGVAVGENGLVRRTTDGGLHWRTVQEASDTGGFLFAVAFYDANTVVAVGRDANNASRILRSTDAGLTWQPVSTTATGSIRALAFRNNIGIAVDRTGGVWRSINGGAQWTSVASVASSSTFPAVPVLAFASDANVLVAFGSSLVRSTDAGSTWSASTTLPTSNSPAVVLAMAFKDASNGVVTGFGANLLYTTDGGVTWATNPTPPWTFDGSAQALAFSASGVALAPGRELLRSTDGGQTWTDAQTFPTVPVSSAVFASPTTGLGVGSTVLRTVDAGQHWTPAAMPTLSSIDNWRNVVFANDATSAFAVSIFGQVAASSDGGVTWVARGTIAPVSDPANNNYVWHTAFASPLVGIVAIDSGSLMRTADGGSTWTAVFTLPAPPSTSNCLGEVKFLTSTIALSSDCNGNLLRSTDAGLTWNAQSTSATASMTFGFADANTGYAVATDPQTAINTILHTTDGGVNWQPVSIGDPQEGSYNFWFQSPTEAFFSTYQSVYHTIDGGATWTLDMNYDRIMGIGYGLALDARTSLMLSSSSSGVMVRKE